MKRLLAILLFAALCLTGLSACGSGNSAASDSPSQENQPAPEQPAPTPDPENLLLNAAQAYTDQLPLEQQLGQMFFVRCPDTDAAALAGQYPIGGYILFGRDFEGQTPDTIRETIRSYQEAAATPILIGVDEEGGTVVRVSSNPHFRAEKFRSPQALYREGGLSLLIDDTKEKDALLSSIGIHVNFAPVCDVSTNPNDFIYARTIGQDAVTTAECIRKQVVQMQADRMGMVLKHFPGYGSNADTHTGIAIDERPLETFRTSDFLPFAAGIEAGAQSVLVSHNIVRCMDDALPASLSPAVHEILRSELGFDGVVMTDDLIMEAITDYTGGENAAVLAVQAGNDMLVSSDFVTQYNAVLAAVQDGSIDPARIREAAVRVIRWKMQLGLIETNAAASLE